MSEDFRAAFAKFMRDLDQREARDPEVLSHIVGRIASYYPALQEIDARAVTQKLIQLTGRSEGWFERMWRLPTPEIRRAIITRAPVLDRKPKERIYPEGGWLGAYLLYAQESEAPLGWHFWCGVSLLAMMARRNFYYDRGRYFLFLNHYIFLLGQSGMTKSTTIGQALAIFDEVQSIIAAKQGGVEPFYQSPERITPEKMLTDLTGWTFAVTGSPRRDTPMFIVSDELTTLLGKDVRGSDRLANFLTDIYMGKRSFRDSTIVGGDRKLTNAICTCLFGSTGSAVRRAITEAMFSEGFMARVITASRTLEDRHGTYDTPPPTDPVQRRILAEQLVPIAMAENEIEVRPTPDAKRWFKDWYKKHREMPPDDEKLVAFWQRKPDHVNRLAGILALSDIAGGPDPGAIISELQTDGVLPIAESYFHTALALIEDEEQRLPEAFAMIGAKEESRELWQLQGVIEKHWMQNGKPISHVDLFHNCRHIIKNAEHMMVMVQTLLMMELIEVVRVGGKVKSYYKPTSRALKQREQEEKDDDEAAELG